jgi:hypothetical protein
VATKRLAFAKPRPGRRNIHFLIGGMKSKIIAGVLLCAAALLAGIGWLTGAFDPSANAVSAPTRVSVATPSTPVVVTAPMAAAPVPVDSAEPASPQGNPVVMERTVQGVKRTVVLEGLDTPEDSPDALLRRVQSSDLQARQNALASLEQMGDRTVVPQLEQIAAQTRDPQQKAEIQEAIDFLKQPTLTEWRAGQRAN